MVCFEIALSSMPIWESPEIVLDYFNALHSSTKSFEGCLGARDLEEFDNALNQANILELHVQGSWFTWTNG